MKGRIILITGIIVVIVLVVMSFGCQGKSISTEKMIERVILPPIVEPTKETQEIGETPIVEETSVVEEVAGPIEYEGVMIPQIEGLRFEDGILYTIDNRYNLPPNTKAGKIISDAVEINDVMTLGIGLRPEVIEVMQKKMMEEKKEFRYPLPFNFEEAKGIKIKEVEDTWLDDAYKSEGVFWDNNSYLEVSDVPVGAKIYSPISTSYYLIHDNNFGKNDLFELSNYSLHFAFTSETYKGGLLFQNERFDVVDLWIGGIGLRLFPSGIEKNITGNKNGGYSFLTETKIGEPIAEIASEEYRLIGMDCFIYQLKNKDSKVGPYEIVLSDISKGLETSLASLLKIENIPVFISP